METSTTFFRARIGTAQCASQRGTFSVLDVGMSSKSSEGPCGCGRVGPCPLSASRSRGLPQSHVPTLRPHDSRCLTTQRGLSRGYAHAVSHLFVLCCGGGALQPFHTSSYVGSKKRGWVSAQRPQKHPLRRLRRKSLSTAPCRECTTSRNHPAPPPIRPHRACSARAWCVENVCVSATVFACLRRAFSMRMQVLHSMFACCAFLR
jgi:hypothetical protein